MKVSSVSFHNLQPLRRIGCRQWRSDFDGNQEPVCPHSGADATHHRFIGKYELRERLNRGGQGTVYRGWDRQLQRDVAIKISHAPSATDVLSQSRMIQEGALLAKIDHPHLARVYDCGVDAGRAYLVLEYVPGMQLQQYVHQTVPGPRQIIRFMEEIAAAVSAAHRAGILHLDLKPENVMVTTDGRCKLIDFGLGWRLNRPTGSSLPVVAGTLGYLSPEQAEGQTANWTEATDVFGLGGILYFLMQRRSPLPETWLDPKSIKLHLESVGQQLLSAGANPRLVAVCCKSLVPDPSQRFPSADAFRRAMTVRRRTAQRILGGLCILVGCLLLWLGTLAGDRLPEGARQSKGVVVLDRATSRLDGLTLNLKIQTPSNRPPQVVVWTPSLGIRELFGLRAETFDGETRWIPGTRSGQVYSASGDEILCLVVFHRSVDIKMAQQILELPLTAPASCEWNKPGPTTLSVRQYEFSNHQRPWKNQMTDARTRTFLRGLQDSLEELRVPYTCLVAARQLASTPVWKIDAQFDLATPLAAVASTSQMLVARFVIFFYEFIEEIII